MMLNNEKLSVLAASVIVNWPLIAEVESSIVCKNVKVDVKNLSFSLMYRCVADASDMLLNLTNPSPGFAFTVESSNL